MFSNTKLLSLPLEQWPADWSGLLNKLGNDINTSGFWKTLVTKYLTATPLEDDTDTTYQAYFQRFWTEARPLLSKNPGGIHEAARRGYDVFIDHWLTRLASNERDLLVNQQSAIGDIPLNLAVDNGHEFCVKTLLAHGAKPDLTGLFEQTPLHRAAYRNHPRIITLLLDGGASWNAQRSDEAMPIHVAVMASSYDAIHTLLQHDMKQLSIPGKEGRTPVYQAAMAGNTNVINILLNYGANVKEINPYTGLSSVHVAAEGNYAELMKMMLADKTNVNLSDGNGLTPLQHCAMIFNPALETMQVLIDNGADVNSGNPTTLHLLAIHANQRSAKTVAAAELLLANQADISVVTNGESVIDLLDSKKRSNELSSDELGLYQVLNQKKLGLSYRTP